MLCQLALNLTRAVPWWSWTLEKIPLTVLCFPKLELQGCRRKMWNRSWLASCNMLQQSCQRFLAASEEKRDCKSQSCDICTSGLPQKNNFFLLRTLWSGRFGQSDVGHFWCFIAHGHWTIPPRGKSCGIVLWCGAGNAMPHPSGTPDVDFVGSLTLISLYHRSLFAGYFHEFRFQTVSF